MKCSNDANCHVLWTDFNTEVPLDFRSERYSRARAHVMSFRPVFSRSSDTISHFPLVAMTVMQVRHVFGIPHREQCRVSAKACITTIQNDASDGNACLHELVLM